ncbi:MAG: hypothetical protein RIR90_1243 [Bacteroidota bacterium]|jgi:uncharacterized membrane protein
MKGKQGQARIFAYFTQIQRMATNPLGIFHWRKLFQYFLQGLLIVAPVVITGYLIYWMVTTIDNLIPIFEVKDINGNSIPRNYGLGILMIVAALILIGFVSSNFFAQRLIDMFDSLLEKTPGIKFIYSSVKDFFEAFAGSKKKFNHPVLVNVDGPDVWRIGFITQEDAHQFGLAEHMTVYVPHSYAISGITYIVPKEKIRAVPNVSSTDAMKFVVSGGVTDVED